MTALTTAPLGPAYARLWTATALSNVGDGIRAAAIPRAPGAHARRGPVLIAAGALAAPMLRRLARG